MGSNPIEGTTASLYPWQDVRLSADYGGVLDVDVNFVPPKKPRLHGGIETCEARFADAAEAVSLTFAAASRCDVAFALPQEVKVWGAIAASVLAST